MKISGFLVATAACVMSAHAWTDEILLPLTDDSWVNQAAPAANYGSRPNLHAHAIGVQETLVRFDASMIAGQQISAAQLTLAPNEIGAPAEIQVRAVTSSWRESTVTFASRPTVEPQVIATFPVTPATLGAEVVFDVATLVQRWASGALADAGVQITVSGSRRVLFDAKEKQGGVRASLRVSLGAPIEQPPRPKVLDLSLAPVTIDQPGDYLLDRSWNVGEAAAQPIIRIEADDVVLDMRGFTISWDSASGSAGIVIRGNNVTVRNGSLISGMFATPLSSDGEGTVVDRMNIGFNAGVSLRGTLAVMRNSQYLGGGISFGANAEVEFNEIHVTRGPATFEAGARVKNNRFIGAFEQVISIVGDNVVFQDNAIDTPTTDMGVMTVSLCYCRTGMSRPGRRAGWSRCPRGRMGSGSGPGSISRAPDPGGGSTEPVHPAVGIEGGCHRLDAAEGCAGGGR